MMKQTESDVNKPDVTIDCCIASEKMFSYALVHPCQLSPDYSVLTGLFPNS